MTYLKKQTLDGSHTYFSPLYQEDCHSLHGAKIETQTYYIEGCEVVQKSKVHSPLNILEIGFGIGLGAITTFEALKDKNVNFVSFEIDPQMIEIAFKENDFSIFIKTKTNFGYELTYQNFKISLYLGNARELIHQFPINYFHAIYQDAFSPKKNPEIWSYEWFCDLKTKSNHDCILSTYSASSSIRKSLIHAGWKVKHGLKCEGKRSSTVATIIGESDPEIIDHLNRSPVPIIYDDKLEEFKKMR